MSKVVKDNRNRSKKPDVGVSAEAPTQTIVDLKLQEKIQQRRFHWRWNSALGWTSLAILGVLLILATASYQYHSKQAATTFLQRSQTAAAAQDFPEQAKWLSRYSMLVPNDRDAIVQLALAVDASADNSPPESRGIAVDQARKQLSSSVARLGESEPGDTTIRDLRSRLIKRLLQLGGPWYREAERQVILLDAPVEDAAATRSMALALSGQVEESMYEERASDKYVRDQNYWAWLAQQKVGEVLDIAVKENSGDLELIARFVATVQNNPELFATSTDNSAEAANPDGSNPPIEVLTPDQRLDSALAAIQDNQDSRSQLILYQVEMRRGDESQATRRLRAAAPLALERLSQRDDTDDIVVASKPASDQSDDAFWDYLLVLEAANRLAKDDSALALQWYERLMALKIESVSSQTAEIAYFRAGSLSLVQGQPKRAQEIWQEGLKEVNPNSLDLLGSLASMLIQNEDQSRLATEALEDFRDAISFSAAGLARVTGEQMTQAQRVALGRKIGSASWRLGMFEGVLAVRRGDMTTAIDRYRQALDSASDIEVEEKTVVATELASLYSRQGLWDQSAATLQKAVDLDPGNAVLRGRAAEAWKRAGNRLEAAEQWRLAGTSNSPAIQIASAEALFNHQLQLLPEQRDFSGVRSLIKRTRSELIEFGETADETTRDEIARAFRRLDVLEVSLPLSGVAAEEYLRSNEMADRVATLAKQYDNDEIVQAFAAERLAEAGLDEESTQALERLQAILGPESTPLAIVRARIEASKGDRLAASDRLVAQVERDRQSAATLLSQAADYAAQANDPQRAYEFLAKIPEDQQTFATLFGMAMLARNLPADAKVLSNPAERLTPLQLSMQWEEKLQDREGTQGSYWRYLKVTRLIDEMRNDPNEIDRNDTRLKTARGLVRDILTWRPRWGEAISLEGWLLAIEKRSEQAVEQLRRGIAAGDRRLQTRQQLFEQLILLNREAEAEEEIRLTSFATDAEVDKYATTRIQLAQRQGEFDRSLAVAESAVLQRPNDFLSHVVLCLTATVAANETKDAEQRGRLLDQALAAITTAEKLAGTAEPAIYSARLRLSLARGDNDSIRAEIAPIDASGLDEFTRLVLKSEAFIALEEFETALPLLIQADDIRPSAQSQVALVQLYRKLGREDDAIVSLRTAQRRSPENAELRNELARALAARDGAAVDWSELSKLLSSNNQATGSNRLLYAVLLGTQGDDQQQNQATLILRELVEEQNERSDDAARFLAVLLKKRWDALPAEQNTLRDRMLVETRSIYDSLLQRSRPEVVDLYRYATLLLDLDQAVDLPKVEGLLRQLQAFKEGALPALEIGIRYAGKTGQQATSPQLVESWAERAFQDNLLNGSKVSSIAGGTLVKLGFIDEGLDWFERAYRDNPETLSNYVVALNRTGRIETSLKVCAEHFQKNSDALSVTLLIESLLNDVQAADTPLYQRLINEATNKFADDSGLLEGLATLRMQQNNMEEAITLYRRVRQLDPLRIRTLNNLAMALSDTPGRAAEGLEPIDQALKLAGDNPELLDTKGVVLLKAGRTDEARLVFQQAVRLSDEPRFQFHLIVALLEQGKEDEARHVWKSLDPEKLNPAGMTASEQTQLATIKNDFRP